MRVKMAVGITGTRNGENWPAAGEVVDLPTGEAELLLANGMAVQVAAAAPEAEKPAAPKPRTAKAKAAETR